MAFTFMQELWQRSVLLKKQAVFFLLIYSIVFLLKHYLLRVIYRILYVNDVFSFFTNVLFY